VTTTMTCEINTSPLMLLVLLLVLLLLLSVLLPFQLSPVHYQSRGSTASPRPHPVVTIQDCISPPCAICSFGRSFRALLYTLSMELRRTQIFSSYEDLVVVLGCNSIILSNSNRQEIFNGKTPYFVTTLARSPDSG